MTKAQQIRGYKQANPTHLPKDIAKACGVKTTYVYQVLHNDQKKIQKAEIKNTVKPVAPTDGQKTLRKEIERLHREVDQWRNLSELNERRVASFMEQVRQAKLHHGGLEYVISYLESRLGITEKPNGASV
jgi:hypothetical protein